MSDYLLLVINIIFFQSLQIAFMKNPKLKFSEPKEKPYVICEPNVQDEKIYSVGINNELR